LFLKGRKFKVAQGGLANAQVCLGVASLRATGIRPPQEQVMSMFRYFILNEINNNMKELIKNKKFLAVYLAWVLIHTFLLLSAKQSYYGNKSDFWPFSSTELGAYDISEWLVYVFAPPAILFLIIAFNDKTTKILLVILSLNIPAKAQSYQAQMQPTYFNWEKCNADRFVHSPCYGYLGFQPYDPETQPKEYQMQEQRYEECEHEKNMETVKHVAIIGVIIIGVISLIVFGAKQVKKNKIAN